MNAVNVGKPSATFLTLLSTGKFTLEIGFMSADSVGKPSVKAPFSAPESSHWGKALQLQPVWKSFPIVLIFLISRKVTLEKSLPSAVDKGTPPGNALGSPSTRKLWKKTGLHVRSVRKHLTEDSFCGEICFFIVAMPRIKPRTLFRSGKHSELHPQST